MAAISDQAILKPENKYKYNGKELQHKEFSDGTGLEDYDYTKRFYDPQIGRFIEVDGLATSFTYLTPYQYASNDPIRNLDLDGLEGFPFQGVTAWAAEQVAENPNSGTSKTIGVFIGVGEAVQGAVEGVGHALEHPLETGKSLLTMNSPEKIASGAAAFGKALNTVKSGTGFEKGELIGKAAGTVAVAVGTGGAGEAGEAGEAAEGLSDVGKISDDANVVRGGLNTPDRIMAGTDTHPSGVTGVSVQCGTCSVQELAKAIPHPKIGVTTVGEVRAAGGDVIKTSGNANHATMTGLSPEKASELLNPVIKNPNN